MTGELDAISGGDKQANSKTIATGSEAPGTVAARGSGWSRLDGALLLFLVLLAFAFRVTNLEQQSLNCDEYHTIIIESETSWPDYWAFAKSVNPDHVPLYFVLSFAWGKLVGTDLVVQRLFPVIVSCLLLVPVYAIGRRWLGGRRSAAMACLYLALAPAMIWHGQYLRTNALLLLVAACSLWSFMHAAEHGGRRWWGLNWALNAIMLLLHIVGSLMLLAQGLYLLLTGRWRAMFAWGSANAVLLLPWFMMSAVGRLETLGHVPPLSHLKFLAMMLGGNFLTLQVDPERQSFGEYHAWVYGGERLWYAEGSDLLRALVMVGVLCAGVWAARQYRGRFNPYLLAGLVAFVPVLFLRGVSLTWISVGQTSHSIVSFVGLALLLGAGVTILQRRSLRAVVVLAIFVPLSVYAVLVVQADTRSDNIAVAELIRERSVDGPIPVLVVDCCWVNDIILPLLLAANLGVDPDQIGDTVYLPPDDAPYQLRVAHTLQAVIDVIEGRPGLAALPDTFVIVASDGSVLGRQDLFERYLKKLGVLTEQQVFSDYRVWVCQRDQSSTAHHTQRYFSRFDYRGYLERAGFVAESEADWRRAKRALRVALAHPT